MVIRLHTSITGKWWGMKPLDQIKQDLEANFPGTQIALEGTSLIIPKERWFEIARYLKDTPEYALDYLSSVTGVDYQQYLETVFHLYSITKKGGPLTIKV